MREHSPRIAYLTSQYPATSHTFISREVAALRELGVQVDTFSIRAPGESELADAALAEESKQTFTVLRQPLTAFMATHLGTLLTRPGPYLRTFALALRHRPPGTRGMALSFAHFGEAILLAAELRRRGVGRLHNHFANSGATVGFLAAQLLNLPWSLTLHGISETDYPAGLMLGRKIEAANFVACVSYFGRGQAMRLVSADHWPKLHIVRCGLPLERLPQKARSAEGTRFVCVGRLSPEKGQAGLLNAFASLRRENDAKLIFVGDGPAGDELQSFARSLGIADRVRFAGRLGEQATLDEIAKADVLILPSFMEGLPIVLMEAMAIGTPVIASRVAGIPELIEEGRSGLLFTPSDWDELASCMRRIASDAKLRASLAEEGRNRVANEFDIKRSAKRIHELLFPEGGK